MDYNKYIQLFKEFINKPNENILMITDNSTRFTVDNDIFRYMLDVFLNKYPDFDLLVFVGRIREEDKTSLDPNFIYQLSHVDNLRSFIVNKKYVEKILNNHDHQDISIYYMNCMESIKRDYYEIIMNPVGGLGNLIFQYCFCKSKEVQGGVRLKFIVGTNYRRGDMKTHRIFNHLDFIEEKDLDKSKYVEQGELSHYYTPLNLNPDYDYIIDGYFQSYKHFINELEYIRQDLFSSVYQEYQDIQKKYKYDKPTCLIHIRRGDYLDNLDFHIVCPDYYYNCATRVIKNMNKETGVKFLIFSDDIEYVKKMDFLVGLDHEIIDIEDPVTCFMIMTTCDHFIIANSSLSLIGYIFRLTKSESCKLVAPSRWYNHGPNYKLFDMIPNNALVIHI